MVAAKSMACNLSLDTARSLAALDNDCVAATLREAHPGSVRKKDLLVSMKREREGERGGRVVIHVGPGGEINPFSKQNWFLRPRIPPPIARQSQPSDPELAWTASWRISAGRSDPDVGGRGRLQSPKMQEEFLFRALEREGLGGEGEISQPRRGEGR